MMQIGELLGMSLADVRLLPASEVTYWMAYMKIKSEPKEDKNKNISDSDKFKMIMQR